MVQSKAKKITISDIAKIAGVSKTSVSFAFNNPDRLNKETLKKILDTAKDLEYIPSPMARNLSKQKYNSIGFLLPQKVEECMENPYLMHLVKSIGSICELNNYSLTLISPNDDFKKATITAAVDGIISLGINVQKEIKKSVKIRNIPCIIIDGYNSNSIINVGIDNKKAAYDIMKLVLDNKHKNIAIIALKANYNNTSGISNMRLNGYKEALKEYNIDIDSIKIYFSEAKLESGAKTFREIIKDKETTAIVCMSDIIAIGCIKEAERCSIDIPKEISIVGFDNIQESTLVTPGLTTVDQNPKIIGSTATKLLFKLIKNKKVDIKSYTASHNLIIRKSLNKPIERKL